MMRKGRILSLLVAMAMLTVLVLVVFPASAAVVPLTSEDFESYAVKDNIAFSGAITHEGTDANGRTADIKNDAAGRSKYARLTSPVSNWIRVTPPAFTSTEDFTTVFSFNAGPEGNMGAMTCRLRPTAQNGNYKSATTFLKVMGDGTFNVQNNNVLQEVQKDGSAVKYMPDVWYDIKVETRFHGSSTPTYDVYWKESASADFELLIADVSYAQDAGIWGDTALKMDYSKGINNLIFEFNGKAGGAYICLDDIMAYRMSDFLVTRVTPADKETGVRLNPQIRVECNAAVAPASVTADTVKLTAGGQTIPSDVSVVGQAVVLEPNDLLQPNTTYTLTLDGVTDTSGEALKGGFSSTFTTLEIQGDPATIVKQEMDELEIADGVLLSNLPLREPKYGTVITGTSSDQSLLKNDGVLVARPTDADREVTFTVKVALSGAEEEKTFHFTIPRQFPNLLEPNAGFENGDSSGWIKKYPQAELTTTPGEVFAGYYAGKVVDPTQSYQSHWKEVDLDPGKEYVMSFWAKLAPNYINNTMGMWDQVNQKNLNTSARLYTDRWTQVVCSKKVFTEADLGTGKTLINGKIRVAHAPNLMANYYYDNFEVFEVKEEDKLKIANTSIPDGYNGVVPDSITVEFSNCVSADRLNSSVFSLRSGGKEIPLVIEAYPKKAVIKPETAFPNGGDCTLSIGLIQDIYGFSISNLTYDYHFLAGPAAPVANDVRIDAPKMATGETISGKYDYFDANDDPQTGSTFRWLRAASADADEADWAVVGTEQSYTLSEADENQYLKFEVTPKTTVAPEVGEAVQSEAAAGPAAPTAVDVRLGSGAVVGRTVEGMFTYQDVNNSPEGGHLYQWYLAASDNDDNPQKLEGKTAKSIDVDAGYEGKYLIFEVTPVSTDRPAAGSAVKSAPVLVTSSNLEPEASAITITGKLFSGSVVTGGYAFTDPDGDGEGKSTYRWLVSDAADGEFTAIDGQTARQILLSDDLAGKYIKFEVTPVDAFGLAGAAAQSEPSLVGGRVPDALYVSRTGSDENDGSEGAPFASLTKARDTIREYKTAGILPDGGVTVYLRGGTYPMNEAFTLTEEDSGTENGRIVYRNYGNEKVVLSGGVDIDYSKFSPVSGEMRDKLRVSEARGKVMVADLSAIGIADFPGINIVSDNVVMPLFLFNGEPMHVSRWPNSTLSADWPKMYCNPGVAGYEGTDPGSSERYDPAGTPPKPFTVQYTESIPTTWTHNLTDIIAYGYWKHDWYGEARYVASFNNAKKQFTSDKPARYGVEIGTAGRPFYMMNVYEELDEPGEWYIDRAAGKMYLYPMETGGNTPKIQMTKADFDLIRTENASYVTIQGLELTTGRKNGIGISGGTGNLINNCELHLFEEFAATITGAGNGIANSHIHHTGTGGVRIDGGDKDSLTHGGNYAENNEIHDFTMLKKSYSPGVHLYGVGNIARHNEFYNCAHAAVLFAGSEHIIEFNEFHNCVLDATDMGAIYSGRDMSALGTEIRYNYFHDLGDNMIGGSLGVQSVFIDDCQSGTLIHHNVFGKGSGANYAVKTHAGQENYITENLFLNTSLVYLMADWDDDSWQRCLSGDPDLWRNQDWDNQIYKTLITVNTNPLYLEKWPWLRTAATMGQNAFRSNTLENNIFAFIEVKRDSQWARDYGRGHAIKGLDNNTTYQGNTDEIKVNFADYAGGNFTIKPDSAMAKAQPEVASIPFSEIGRRTYANQPPQAQDISIIGDVVVGGTLTGIYTYSDPERDLEGNTSFRWLVSDTENGTYTAIPNQTGNTFVFTADYSGKFIKFEVTPATADGQVGSAYTSPALRAIADKGSLLVLLDRVKAEKAVATAGTSLGQYPQSAIDAIGLAIDAAEAVYENPESVLADYIDAADRLSAAYSDFKEQQVTSFTLSGGSGTIAVPAGMLEMTLELGNVTGPVVLTVPEGRLPATTATATINGKQVTLTIADGTLLPTKEMALLTPLSKPTAEIFGDVYASFVVGSGDYNQPIRILIENAIGKAPLYIENGVAERITAQLAADSAAALGDNPYGFLNAGTDLVIWTAKGGEFAAAELVAPSNDATLAEIMIGGKRLSGFKPDKTSYSYTLPAGTKDVPTVTATPTNPKATVEVGLPGSLPGTVEIIVTAQDGTTKTTYTVKLDIKKETENVQPPITNNNAGNTSYTGGTTGSTLLGGGQSKRFTDTVGHWAENDIKTLAEKGIVSGVTETTFEPERAVTRAEFAMLITKALNITTVTGSGDWKDVPADAWYASAVNAAANVGLIVGYDGWFRPDELITREEIAVIIAKAYSYLGETAGSGAAQKFADQYDISDWAYPYVDAATSAGLVYGVTDDTFSPWEYATRAQAAALIRRLLDN